MIIRPGVPEQFYLDSWRFDGRVREFKPEHVEMKSSQRLSGGDLSLTFARPYANCPLRITKRSWQLTFDTARPTDIARLHQIVAHAGFMYFSPWRPICEEWYAVTTGRAQREDPFSGGIPSGELPSGTPSVDYAAVAIEGGVETAVTWTDVVNNRQTWTSTNAGTGYVKVFYCPLFRVSVESYTEGVRAPEGNIELWTLNLQER